MSWYEIAFSIVLEINFKFKLEMGLKLAYTSWLRDSFFGLGLITGAVAVSIEMLIILVKRRRSNWVNKSLLRICNAVGSQLLNFTMAYHRDTSTVSDM